MERDGDSEACVCEGWTAAEAVEAGVALAKVGTGPAPGSALDEDEETRSVET